MGVEDYNKQQLDRLREHKIAFDQEAMWAAMQKKKKRRGALYFFTMALVALAIVFLSCGLYSWYNGEKSWFSSETVSISPPLIKESNDYKDSNVNESQVVSNYDSNIAVNSELSEAKSITQGEKLFEKQSGSQVSEKPLYNSGVNIDSRESIKRDQKNRKNTSESNSSLGSAANDVLNKNIDDDDIISMPPPIDNETRKPINQDAEKVGETSVNPSKFISIQVLESGELSFLESMNITKISGEELKVNAVGVTEVLVKPKSRLQVGIYGGAGHLFRQSGEENDTTFASVETLEEVSIGIELKYQINPNLFVRSGLEYWHATDRQESSSITSYSIDNIEDLEEIPSGLTADDKGIVVSTYYAKIHTIYQSYNVPLLIGWNSNNTKWNLFAEAGVLYNFKTERRWDDSIENLETNRYNVGTQNQVSPIAGVGLSYSPNNNLEFFARSNWRGSQFVTQEETVNTLKFGAIRAQVGIRIGI